jgi:hypothetical protein
MDLGGSPASRTVHCARHGDNREAFMCKHLLEGFDQGFFYDSADRNSPYPDAWCRACERVRSESGGDFESPYARATFKLVCGACYEEIKAKNVLTSE